MALSGIPRADTATAHTALTYSRVPKNGSNIYWISQWKRPPGSRYKYIDGVSVLIGKILREATGQRIDNWARENLFRPIGITDFYWKITPDGAADTEGGLYLKPQDLARIGYLFLRGGNWNGTQVLSENWIDASIKPVTPDARENAVGYGYQWWVPQHEDGETQIFAGNGYGGQRLMVSKAHDLVLVINGWSLHNHGDKSTATIMQEIIIPALKDTVHLATPS